MTTERKCLHCGSTNIRSKGLRKNSNGEFRRFLCDDCGQKCQIPLNLLSPTVEDQAEDKKPKIKMIEPYLEFRKEFPNAKGFVVTCAINDTGVNKPFLAALEAYCDAKKLKLLVIPVKYLNPSAMNTRDDCTWPPEVAPYLFHRTYTVDNVLKVIGDCNIQATATHPLTGIDGLTDGMTTIVGHPVVQMKTVPVNEWRDPIILHSTGSVSLKNNYSASKAGYRASYHHCFAGVVVEFDKSKTFHIRQIMADSNGGFYDLGDYWGPEGFERTDPADALVLGDEHLIFADANVQKATYFANDSIVQTLRPKVLVRHDVLDCFSVSSHHSNNFILRYTKHRMPVDKHSIEAELRTTVDQLVATTPSWSKSLIVGSNHHDHLDRWLNIENGIKFDYVNAKIYHQLMYLMLSNIDKGIEKNAFRTYVEEVYKAPHDTIAFAEDGFEMHDIVLSMHGDRGPNGARGSITNLSKIGEKAVIGHSHSPGIQAGCWQVGTSSLLRLEYNKGPSSWLHTHCVIYPNGKRQLISVISGRWRAGK